MPYVCNNCGRESARYFGLCPVCHQGTGEFVEERNDSKGKSKSGVKLNIMKVNPDVPELKACMSTKFAGLNAILSSSKGFVEGQVVLLGASPGVGKSTLCVSIANDDTLYVSSEENYGQVNARALRVNPNVRCSILSSTSIDEILTAMRESKEKLIIIDSLNSIEFGVGYLTVAKYANQIVNLTKELKKVTIIISQVGKTGEISGMNAIPHMVDTVLYLERSEVSSNIIATTDKNRYGEIGGVCVFQHAKDGSFVEVDVDHMEVKNEIGATYTETRFGHKRMTIAIEALVANAQNKYGIIRANGYNGNRLSQLIGIIGYYGKINLSEKDVYVAISNGLYTNDISIELAMANSILSSFYGKNYVTQAYGEVRLNGKIVNGTINGKPINHINELIDLYKKGR